MMTTFRNRFTFAILSLFLFSALDVFASKSLPAIDSVHYAHFIKVLAQEGIYINTLSATDPECYDFGRNYGKSSFYIELLAGLDSDNRSFRSKTVENEGYVITRRNTESQKNSWLTGIRVSGVSQRNIAYRGGLFLGQINEEFSAPITLTTITTDPTTGVMDTLVTMTDTVASNRFRTLDIQVSVGYEMDFNKCTASVNAGVMMNMVFKPNGTFISPAGELVTYTPDLPTSFPTYKDNAGFGLISHVDLGYKLSEKIHAVAEVNVRYRLGSLTRIDFPLDQSYVQFGVLGGLRYVFN